jgi:hypothetical protein
MGKPCASRATGLSKASDTLYTSNRPSRRRRRASFADALHFLGAHRLEPLRDFEVGAKPFELVHPADGRRDGEAHRVAEHLLRRENAVRDGTRLARHGLHPEHRDAALVAFGEDGFSEAEEVRVVRVERELAGVPRVAARDHLHVHGGPLVAGEADEARLALALGEIEGLEDAALAVRELRVVVEDDAVDLPHVEVVRTKSAQRLLEHLHGEGPVAAVRAYLGHQDDLVAPPARRQSAAQPFFAAAVVVLPAVVEEVDPAVDPLSDELVGQPELDGVAEMMPALGERRDLEARLAQRAARDGERAHSGSSFWDGYPCCSRPTLASKDLVILYSSSRPSAASGRTRSRSACISSPLIG